MFNNILFILHFVIIIQLKIYVINKIPIDTRMEISYLRLQDELKKRAGPKRVHNKKPGQKLQTYQKTGHTISS